MSIPSFLALVIPNFLDSLPIDRRGAGTEHEWRKRNHFNIQENFQGLWFAKLNSHLRCALQLQFQTKKIISWEANQKDARDALWNETTKHDIKSLGQDFQWQHYSNDDVDEVTFPLEPSMVHHFQRELLKLVYKQLINPVLITWIHTSSKALKGISVGAEQYMDPNERRRKTLRKGEKRRPEKTLRFLSR